LDEIAGKLNSFFTTGIRSFAVELEMASKGSGHFPADDFARLNA
jgi:hypothetical protein